MHLCIVSEIWYGANLSAGMVFIVMTNRRHRDGANEVNLGIPSLSCFNYIRLISLRKRFPRLYLKFRIFIIGAVATMSTFFKNAVLVFVELAI